MTLLRSFPILFAVAALAIPAAPAGAIDIDGSEGGEYGAVLAVQGVGTDFGDNDDSDPATANGSELDQIFGTIQGNTLFLFLAGNLETNFNKLELFIDSVPGGQDTLRGDNPDIDFNGLNRMGRSETEPGLVFDLLFESDYYLNVSGGGDPVALFANWAETPAGGGGSGAFLGEGTTQSDGSLTGGTNPEGVRVTLDNSNTLGVGSGCGADNGAAVTTGVEWAIPLSAIGNPTGCVKVLVFVNSSSHDFASNQVLPTLPVDTCNLGEPRLVDFNQIDGTQWVEVCPDDVPVTRTTWGRIKARAQ